MSTPQACSTARFCCGRSRLPHGTLIGATLLGILNNGLKMMEIVPYPQLMIRGAIILAGTYISRERRA